jgi:hypothetical protein
MFKLSLLLGTLLTLSGCSFGWGQAEEQLPNFTPHIRYISIQELSAGTTESLEFNFAVVNTGATYTGDGIHVIARMWDAAGNLINEQTILVHGADGTNLSTDGGALVDVIFIREFHAECDVEFIVDGDQQVNESSESDNTLHYHFPPPGISG